MSLCRGKQAPQQTIQRHISTLWIITNILAVLIALVSVGFYFSIPSIYAKSLSQPQIQYAGRIFVFVILHLIFSFYTQTLSGVALGYEKYAFSSSLNLCSAILRFLLLIPAVLVGKQALWIAVVDAGLAFSLFLFSLLYCKRNFRFSAKIHCFDITVFRQALPLCFAIFLQTVVNQANNNVDKFLIGIKLTPEIVSLYSVAMFVFSTFSSLTTIPISMYAPKIIQTLGKTNDVRSLEAQIVPAMRLTSCVGGCILFGFIAVGKPFVQFLYGDKYLQAYVLALIIMVPMYLNMLPGVLVNVLDALNKRIIRSWVLLGTTAANVLLTIWWLDRWGVTGAAVATCLCTMLGQVLIMGIYYAKALNLPIISLYFRAWRGILPGQILGAAAALLLCRFLVNPLVSLLLGGSIFVLIFGLCFLAGSREARSKAASLLRRKDNS